MVNDAKLSEIRALAGKKGGEETQSKKDDIALAKNKANNGIDNRFEIFLKKYPGTKISKLKEWQKFQKHKDWETQIDLLIPALDKEIEWRIKLNAANKFIPSWKNCSTWLNNRCWEQELCEIIEGKKTEREKAINSGQADSNISKVEELKLKRQQGNV